METMLQTVDLAFVLELLQNLHGANVEDFGLGLDQQRLT
jgi:hypothetical protein